MYNNTHFMEMTKVISEPVAFKHTIFLDECIDNTSYYRSAIATLKSANESDIISMVFDTEGGLCHTASVFESAMRECKAHIKGELCGEVASAGTKLALACDDWVVGDDVVFMCHTASYGASNSAEKLRDQVEFLDKWITKMNTATYTGFLTEQELDKMNDSGKEYWFGVEELVTRLQNFAEHRKKLQESAVEEMLNVQEETAIRAEKVIQRELLSKGVVTEQDLAVTEKVQNAMAELDQSLTDEAFEELLNSGEEEEESQPSDWLVKEWESEDGKLSFTVDNVDYYLEGKEVYIGTYSNIESPLQEMSYKDCKTVIKSVPEIDIPLNARKMVMVEGIVKFFETLREELLQE